MIKKREKYCDNKNNTHESLKTYVAIIISPTPEINNHNKKQLLIIYIVSFEQAYLSISQDESNA